MAQSDRSFRNLGEQPAAAAAHTTSQRDLGPRAVLQRLNRFRPIGRPTPTRTVCDPATVLVILDHTRRASIRGRARGSQRVRGRVCSFLAGLRRVIRRLTQHRTAVRSVSKSASERSRDRPTRVARESRARRTKKSLGHLRWPRGVPRNNTAECISIVRSNDVRRCADECVLRSRIDRSGWTRRRCTPNFLRLAPLGDRGIATRFDGGAADDRGRDRRRHRRGARACTRRDPKIFSACGRTAPDTIGLHLDSQTVGCCAPSENNDDCRTNRHK